MYILHIKFMYIILYKNCMYTFVFTYKPIHPYIYQKIFCTQIQIRNIKKCYIVYERVIPIYNIYGYELS